MNSEMR